MNMLQSSRHALRHSREALVRCPVAFVLGFTLLTACGGSGPKQATNTAVPVTIAQVTSESVPVTLQAIGTVESPSTVSVRSRVGGELVSVHFKEGEEVTQGQVLFTLDRRPLEASLEEAKAGLARDQAQAKKARSDVARYRDLVAKDYVTKEQYDQVVATADAMDATVAADQAAVKNAEVQLGYATITAPISGRTGSLLVHAGNVVKANDQYLVVIQKVEPMLVRFAVPQQYLSEIRRRSSVGNLAVTAQPPGSETPLQTGELTFLDNSVNANTGTIELKASFGNRQRALWPGQFVDVSLRLSTQDDAVVAPSRAVQTGQNGDYVFVVKKDMTVDSRPVKVDRTLDDKAVIAEGLKPGETVVTDGQLRLVPGAKVEVKKGVETPQPEATT